MNLLFLILLFDIRNKKYFLWLFSFIYNFVMAEAHKDWTNSAYPDLRGVSYHLCASRIPDDSLLYICDPDRIFNASQLIRINNELEKLAVGTPCPCQRRSQCTSGGDTGSPFHGFVVSIALVDNLQMNFHSPSEQQLIDRAESFCKSLEGRWALGDCGNSVIVFVWRHYKKVIIWPARLAERYITNDERKGILSRVNDLIQADRWAEALSQVTYELHKELKGEPEERVDTGTISLVIAVGVAAILTILITCCVCAFRCGNSDSLTETKQLPNRTRIPLRRSMNDITPTLTEAHLNGSQLQKSLSRSPNFQLRNPSSFPPQQLNFMAYSDTTIV